MTENPYLAPEAEIDISPPPIEAETFYVVSKKKMAILFISTLGLYQLYWIYRNWRLYKTATGQRMWPVARAIFPVFFIHSLFREVDHRRSQNSSGWPEWNHSSHATMLVIMLIVSHIVDRMAGRSIGSPVTDFISLLFLIPITFAFASAQEKSIRAVGIRRENPMTGSPRPMSSGLSSE